MPRAATATEPTPILTKNCRRLISSGLSGEAVGFGSSDINPQCHHFEAGAAGARLGSIKALNGDEPCRLGRHEVIGLHGDGVGRTAQRAQTAADAAGLVLQHRGSGDAAQFRRLYIFQLEAEQLGMVRDGINACPARTESGPAEPVPGNSRDKHPRSRRRARSRYRPARCLREWC